MAAIYNKIEKFYDEIADQRDSWKKKNYYYHGQIARLYNFLIPSNQKILDIGCGTGDLLAALNPVRGVGIDISQRMIGLARKKHPQFTFKKIHAEDLQIAEKFDYIILSDVIGDLVDVQKVFQNLHTISNENTRIIINYYNNFLWEPILLFGEKCGLKMPVPTQNWLSQQDVKNLFELSNLEVVKDSEFLLLPINIFFISAFLNKYIARLPFIRKLCLIRYFIVRKKPSFVSKEYSVSVIIPARNEEKNIEKVIREIPKLGKKTELIFIEGHSKDNTKNEIKRLIKKNNRKNIILVNQGNGIGKADAVRKGIKKATGEIIIIFDADLTVDPVELFKFYDVLKRRKAEFVQGSRLVYPMEKQAMRMLNIFGNKFFSVLFSFLLDQQIKDTLCGTKGLFRSNYIQIEKNRSFFGDFDPFGDFDLIFGVSKLNLKIIEIPIRYKARRYGETNIQRFRNGLTLLRMTILAAVKLKFF